MPDAAETEAMPSERLELGSEGNQSDLLSVLPDETGFEDVQERNEAFESWFESERATRGLDPTRDKPAAFREWLETHWSQKEE